MPNFYGNLEASGWMCFGDEPIRTYYIVVREFNVNAAKSNFSSDLLVTLRVKQVRFDPARINAYYGLPDADNDVHKESEREAGEDWFVTHFHGGHRP
ncbi:hypothetical protein KY284_036036 [Solanum tuberosum]|nr:hypothetical protein KY284_036036 [Solanum tuberosum]